LRRLDGVLLRARLRHGDAALPVGQALSPRPGEPRTDARAGAAALRDRRAAGQAGPRAVASRREGGRVKRWLQIGIGVAISAVCLWLSMRDVDPRAVGYALSKANYLGF